MSNGMTPINISVMPDQAEVLELTLKEVLAMNYDYLAAVSDDTVEEQTYIVKGILNQLMSQAIH